MYNSTVRVSLWNTNVPLLKTKQTTRVVKSDMVEIEWAQVNTLALNVVFLVTNTQGTLGILPC